MVPVLQRGLGGSLAKWCGGGGPCTTMLRALSLHGKVFVPGELQEWLLRELRLCLIELVPDGSKMDPLLTTAEPISNGGMAL